MTIDITQRSERFLLILTLGALTTLGPMAIDLYLPALPAIASDMGEPLHKIQFTLSAYTVGFALGQLIYGPLSDRFGRQKVMLPGIIFYMLTSLLAATCTNANQLIMVRILQAMAGAAIMVTIPAMVRDLFPREESAKALSSILMVMTVAPLVAPILGGQILKFWGWQTLFLFLAGIAVLGFILALSRISETLPLEKRSRTSGGELVWNYLDILKNREAMGCILCHGFFFGGMFAFISGSPFIYIELFGVKPENYGLLFSLNIISMAIMNMVNMRLIGRLQLFTILKTGSVIAAVASLTLLFNAKTGFGGLFGIVLPVMAFVACMGLTGPNSNALALAHFPKTAGTANALAGALRFSIGGLSSVAVGFLQDGTAMSMALVMAGCGLLSVSSLLLTRNQGVTAEELTELTGSGNPVNRGASA
ncbi:Bcr/CflA family multidrug efflux MFS transporter [Endozoicomonas sp. Mp262]|uniref:Bcr/CflA family multidrug efflux MFS transporter n=1 Tax=Endozoicomonas sp. Mp262 TaxID=2919499 RepID=UPI0021D8C7E8